MKEELLAAFSSRADGIALGLTGGLFIAVSKLLLSTTSFLGGVFWLLLLSLFGAVTGGLASGHQARQFHRGWWLPTRVRQGVVLTATALFALVSIDLLLALLAPRGAADDSRAKEISRLALNSPDLVRDLAAELPRIKDQLNEQGRPEAADQVDRREAEIIVAEDDLIRWTEQLRGAAEAGDDELVAHLVGEEDYLADLLLDTATLKDWSDSGISGPPPPRHAPVGSTTGGSDTGAGPFEGWLGLPGRLLDAALGLVSGWGGVEYKEAFAGMVESIARGQLPREDDLRRLLRHVDLAKTDDLERFLRQALRELEASGQVERNQIQLWRQIMAEELGRRTTPSGIIATLERLVRRQVSPSELPKRLLGEAGFPNERVKQEVRERLRVMGVEEQYWPPLAAIEVVGPARR